MNEAMLRGRRIAVGKCPTHGVVLVTAEDMMENDEKVGKVYGCPLEECEFTVEARNGSRLMKLLR